MYKASADATEHNGLAEQSCSAVFPQTGKLYATQQMYDSISLSVAPDQTSTSSGYNIK